jgi:hypothetical protein
VTRATNSTGRWGLPRRRPAYLTAAGSRG